MFLLTKINTNKNVVLGCGLKIVQNPGYMKENFVICIESLHVGDIGLQSNVSYLKLEQMHGK